MNISPVQYIVVYQDILIKQCNFQFHIKDDPGCIPTKIFPTHDFSIPYIDARNNSDHYRLYKYPLLLCLFVVYGTQE